MIRAQRSPRRKRHGRIARLSCLRQDV